MFLFFFFDSFKSGEFATGIKIKRLYFQLVKWNLFHLNTIPVNLLCLTSGSHVCFFFSQVFFLILVPCLTSIYIQLSNTCIPSLTRARLHLICSLFIIFFDFFTQALKIGHYSVAFFKQFFL